jgi:hypothetical protein
MGHNLAIIVVQNLFFIGSYGIDMDVIHLFVLFEHRRHVHRLDTNVICLFVLFKHECCVFIHIVYTRKLCTWLPCINNAWHSCVNDINPWNNRFHMDLEWTHEKPINLWWCSDENIISQALSSCSSNYSTIWCYFQFDM